MIKKLALFFAGASFVFSQGCANFPNSPTSFGLGSNYGFHNSALVIGRTISREYDGAGFQVYFRNMQTKEFFGNASSVFGTTGFQYFALWLPPGRYKLNGFFVFDGDVGPIDEPLMFTVQPGLTQYIGTLVTSWGIPEEAKAWGRPTNVTRNGRLTCPMILACDGRSPGMSSNSKPAAPIVALLVFDEGPNFVNAIKKSIPSLPDREVIWSLLK